jgi:hypothetical protein
MQASINEDLEQRRRQLDSKGEARKIIIAKEVSRISLSLCYILFFVGDVLRCSTIHDPF